MDGYLSLINWSPVAGGAGGLTDLSFLVVVVMSFIGASIVTRLVDINTSFNFSVNFMVMLAGCLLVNHWVGANILPVENDLVVSAVNANFGMTMAGFGLLFTYRNAV